MKTEIEEKIRQHNELWNAFQKLNGKITNVGIGNEGDVGFCFGSTQTAGYNFVPPAFKLEVSKPKFAVGDWFVPHKPKEDKCPSWISLMDIYNNIPCHIEGISPMFGYLVIKEFSFHPDWCEKWLPKRGEYISVSFDQDPVRKYICIVSEGIDESFIPYAGLTSDNQLIINGEFGYYKHYEVAPATPEEIALLDSKLAEQGKRFDKDRCEIMEIEKEIKNCEGCAYGINNCCFYHKPGCVRTPEVRPIPKHKEPIIGEMAIMWDKYKKNAVCAIYGDYEDELHYTSDGIPYDYAILYESAGQYKQFLKS